MTITNVILSVRFLALARRFAASELHACVAIIRVLCCPQPLLQLVEEVGMSCPPRNFNSYIISKTYLDAYHMLFLLRNGEFNFMSIMSKY